MPLILLKQKYTTACAYFIIKKEVSVFYKK